MFVDWHAKACYLPPGVCRLDDCDAIRCVCMMCFALCQPTNNPTDLPVLLLSARSGRLPRRRQPARPPWTRSRGVAKGQSKNKEAKGRKCTMTAKSPTHTLFFLLFGAPAPVLSVSCVFSVQYMHPSIHPTKKLKWSLSQTRAPCRSTLRSVPHSRH